MRHVHVLLAACLCTFYVCAGGRNDVSDECLSLSSDSEDLSTMLSGVYLSAESLGAGPLIQEMQNRSMTALVERRACEFNELANLKHAHYEDMAWRLNDLADRVKGRRDVQHDKLVLLAKDNAMHRIASVSTEYNINKYNRGIDSDVRDFAIGFSREYIKQVRLAIEAVSLNGYEELCRTTLSISLLDHLAQEWFNYMQAVLQSSADEFDYNQLVDLSDKDISERMHSLFKNFDLDTATKSTGSRGTMRGEVATLKTKSIDQLSVELRKLASEYRELVGQTTPFIRTEMSGWRGISMRSLVKLVFDKKQNAHLKVLMENQASMDVGKAMETKKCVDEFINQLKHSESLQSFNALCNAFGTFMHQKTLHSTPIGDINDAHAAEGNATQANESNQVAEIKGSAAKVPESATSSLPPNTDNEESEPLGSVTGYLLMLSENRRAICIHLRRAQLSDYTKTLLDEYERFCIKMGRAIEAGEAQAVARQKSQELAYNATADLERDKKIASFSELICKHHGQNIKSKPTRIVIADLIASFREMVQDRLGNIRAEVALIQARLDHCKLSETAMLAEFHASAAEFIKAARDESAGKFQNTAVRTAASRNDVAVNNLTGIFHEKGVAILTAERLANDLAMADGELRALDALVATYLPDAESGQ